jgi:hypothetical protein
VESEGDIDRVFEETDFVAGTTLIEIMLDREIFPNYNSRRS